MDTDNTIDTKSVQPSLLESLPDELLVEIMRFINYQGKHESLSSTPLAALYYTSRRLRQIAEDQCFVRDNRLMALCFAVTSSQADKVSKIIKQHPYLLFKPTYFTDPSGREFYTSLYEYASWALDAKLQAIIHQVIPADEIEKYLGKYKVEPISQSPCDIEEFINSLELQHLTTEDLAQLINTITYHQENKSTDSQYFDIQPILLAYDAYVNFYVTSQPFDFRTAVKDKREEFFFKVLGGMQRLLPTHIIRNLCNPPTATTAQTQFFTTIMNLNEPTSAFMCPGTEAEVEKHILNTQQYSQELGAALVFVISGQTGRRRRAVTGPRLVSSVQFGGISDDRNKIERYMRACQRWKKEHTESLESNEETVNHATL